MQWGQGSHTEQKMPLRGAAWSSAQSCPAALTTEELHITSQQYREQASLCAILCSKVTSICFKQLPLFLSVPDVYFSLAASY